MEKIRNIQQLKAEKEKLRHRKAELEKAIRYDWRDLKDSVKPASIASQLFSAVFKKGEDGEQRSSLTGKISAFARDYAGKLAGKLGMKFGQWFRN